MDLLARNQIKSLSTEPATAATRVCSFVGLKPATRPTAGVEVLFEGPVRIPAAELKPSTAAPACMPAVECGRLDTGSI